MADELEKVVAEMMAESYNRGMKDGVSAMLEVLKGLQERKLLVAQEGLIDLLKDTAIKGLEMKTSVEKGFI